MFVKIKLSTLKKKTGPKSNFGPAFFFISEHYARTCAKSPSSHDYSQSNNHNTVIRLAYVTQ
ncbi:hypothetical protein BSQ39_12160 [Loigolactobacillus backii]|uniref:Uncharacterized protein n=1 Tax=Loigolactobacillus backii TaxID=375175 RepID=A0A192GZQ8_9LACO|nr:hypothetical protein AYR52_00200 [Loigolactobacillus backii]ANK61518.1 hypothetical protein AYR53_01310 [Loigolactobacillus backii]ANK63808.1 hypothetical protein AYR54_00195 [Loigolactobacillus backii]ANK66256.1 hypothetical protein AYR55_00195 [Loigolactobacillus backii]ANK69284.1 hypothetical protein AYR56_03405 [Loigolactobacillus backii]